MAAAPQAVGQAYISNQNQDDQILSIVDRGLNDIVLQIKHTLGGNINDTNQSASDIIIVLENLSNTIQAGIPVGVNPRVNGIVDINADADSININANRQPVIGATIQPKINTGLNNLGAFNNLNYNSSVNGTHVYANEGVQLNLSNAPDLQRVTNRLKNCQTLEYLYLKKHDELFKVFAFTLNLFDKYKYAIKLILFLLKHLVNKNIRPIPPAQVIHVPGHVINNPAPPIMIDLPETIIPNIGKLVRDQKSIQDVITNMQTELNNNPAQPNNQLRVLTEPMIPNMQGREGDARNFAGRLDDRANPSP